MKFVYFLICFSLTLAVHAQVEPPQAAASQQQVATAPFLTLSYRQGYVSDNLKTYLHSGPGANYRIIGRLSAGEKISISNQQKNNFTQVSTSKGRQGWLPNQVLTAQKTLKYQVTGLQKERDEATSLLQKLQEKLMKLQADRAQSLGNLDQQLAATQAQLQQLQQEYAVAKQGRIDAENALQLLQGNLTSSMWKQGALIAMGGLILGFFLAFVPRPARRKKTGYWMN